MDSQPSYLRTRLSAMFFFEFFVWASWYVPVGGYIINALKFQGFQISAIFLTTAVGAIISPLFVGYVADRFFSTERVLCFLHIVGGVCLCLAALPESFSWLWILLIINGACFMPTLALANSLAFRNIPDPDKFPRIAMFGTIGWIISGLIVGFLLGETRPWFFFLAGAAGILMGLYCLTLPHTPPKRPEETGGDVLGFGAIALLKERSFLIFVLAAFLIAIPATFYFVGCNGMLVETGWPVPTALMTIGQCTEIVVMFTMPFFIGWLGLRKVLALGMLTWTIRYLCFSTLSPPLVLLGLIVHGFGYCFVFVGAYIFVDKKAPRDLRASAQSFIAWVMLGWGMFLGNLLGGFAVGQYPPAVEGIADAPKISRLAKTIDADDDGRIVGAELDRIPDGGLELDDKTYAREDVIEFFRKADDNRLLRTKGDVRAAVEGEISVKRSDWLAAQSHNWTPVWLWPAGAAALIGIFFWFGSRDEETAEQEQQESAEQEQEGSSEEDRQAQDDSAGE